MVCVCVCVCEYVPADGVAVRLDGVCVCVSTYPLTAWLCAWMVASSLKPPVLVRCAGGARVWDRCGFTPVSGGNSES